MVTNKHTLICIIIAKKERININCQSTVDRVVKQDIFNKSDSNFRMDSILRVKTNRVSFSDVNSSATSHMPGKYKPTY